MAQTKIIKSTLLNIDSLFRELYPKNICYSDGIILPSNALTFTKNSTLININFPDHKLNEGDNITIQNIEGISKIIANSIYLFNDFKYAIIVVESNNIESDYKKYTNNLYFNIDLFGDQIESSLVGNISLNNLLGVKKCLISSDIPSSYLSVITSSSSLLTILSTTSSLVTSVINTKCLFIELPVEFSSLSATYYQLNQVFKISYLHIGGIPLGYLNANYPINNYNYQSSFEVYSIIDANNLSININFKSFGNINGGGSNILAMKILNTLTGYPEADDYVINLKKSFNNVTNIELISSEFPYVDMVVKQDINDKLYWKNIEDGNYIYSITLNEGFYSSELFLKHLIEKINDVKRINYTTANKNYNNFDIILESNMQKVTFNPYNNSKLPNSLTIRKENIDLKSYFVLTVDHPNNLVDVGDKIIIFNSDNVTVSTNTNNTIFDLINSKYINKTHIVYGVNLKNSTYDIILGNLNELSVEQSDKSLNGGENIMIKNKTKVSFLFNKSDTCGELLGFKNVGNEYSILDFNSTITNFDQYVNSINLNSVGNNISYNSGFMNFVGKFNYFLMYLNDIEYIYSNNNEKSAFAKIQLSGNPGDILFNTFIPTPTNIYYKGFPIPTLTELTIKFTYPDGSRINFRNINHSFTLKITEEQIQNNNTYLNSNTISTLDELKTANLKD